MGKVTDDQKVRIVELYTSGQSTLQIGRRLQVSPATVTRLAAGRIGCHYYPLDGEGGHSSSRTIRRTTTHSPKLIHCAGFSRKA